MFQSNPTFMNQVQNDKYNCLSFTPQPQMNPSYFQSNPTPQTKMNQGWGMNANGNGQWANQSMNKQQSNGPRDKYDVFDMCMGNNRNPYFN